MGKLIWAGGLGLAGAVLVGQQECLDSAFIGTIKVEGWEHKEWQLQPSSTPDRVLAVPSPFGRGSVVSKWIFFT